MYETTTFTFSRSCVPTDRDSGEVCLVVQWNYHISLDQRWHFLGQRQLQMVGYIPPGKDIQISTMLFIHISFISLEMIMFERLKLPQFNIGNKFYQEMLNFFPEFCIKYCATYHNVTTILCYLQTYHINHLDWQKKVVLHENICSSNGILVRGLANSVNNTYRWFNNKPFTYIWCWLNSIIQRGFHPSKIYRQ